MQDVRADSPGPSAHRTKHIPQVDGTCSGCEVHFLLCYHKKMLPQFGLYPIRPISVIEVKVNTGYGTGSLVKVGYRGSPPQHLVSLLSQASPLPRLRRLLKPQAPLADFLSLSSTHVEHHSTSTGLPKPRPSSLTYTALSSREFRCSNMSSFLRTTLHTAQQRAHHLVSRFFKKQSPSPPLDEDRTSSSPPVETDSSVDTGKPPPPHTNDLT